jgi:flagellar motor switch/type III secretory pathway protein FliN
MKDVFDEIGTLDVIIGRGSITAYEIANLKPNDIVTVSDREAGDPVLVLFNSQYIAHGEIMSIEGIFAVRIIRPIWNPEPLPYHGQPDDLTEVLEFQIRLASVKMRLRDLEGVGENSIINLGVAAQQQNRLELAVARMVIATGTICRIEGHRFGIQVLDVTGGIGGDVTVFTSGSIASKEVESSDQYHIFSPDRFTKSRIRAVADIHERFAANLNAVTLGDVSDLHLQYVDQVTFADLLDSFENEPICVLADSVAAERRPEEASSRKYVVQNEHTELKHDDESISRLNDRQEALDSIAPLGAFLVFVATTGQLSSGVVESDFLVDIFTSLRNGWKQRYRMPFLKGTVIDAERCKQMFVETELMLVAGIEGDAEKMVVAYPIVNVAKIMSALDD